jgi:protein transport protein SEC24
MSIFIFDLKNPKAQQVRPPQPVIFLFVIDVSYAAVQSGMLHVAAGTILNNLDRIPNDDDRTKVGFITVDRCLHFYNLSTELTEPQMLVVCDLEDDIVLPLPTDLTVSLSESRERIKEFLGKLPNMFIQTHETQNKFSAALKCAQKILGSVGGKIIALQVSLPNVGEGALKDREDAKLLGTSKAHVLLQPATNFYKSFAVSCSPAQIGIDLFLFGPSYADVATLSK